MKNAKMPLGHFSNWKIGSAGSEGVLLGIGYQTLR
jgi:hypothetical protein